jgi:tetratricopeptide (TPR) repeat protein
MSLLVVGFAPVLPLAAQQQKQLETRPTVVEEEPPEEDPELKPQVYSFNPLEGARNITAGNFYYKKGNYRAASRRYLEATKWDPTSGEALLKLAAAYEKLHNFEGARESYTKYLEVAPDAKDAAEVQKKLAHLPKPKAAAATPSSKK